MTNQLTRTIMENIVKRCSTIKENSGHRANLRDNDINMLKKVIHKHNRLSIDKKNNEDTETSDSLKFITIEELAGLCRKSEDDKRMYRDLKESEKDKSVNKVSLEDLVPKVSLTSIGKK